MMRLINAHDFTIQEFSAGAAPPYAILSHTWSVEEVTLQDMTPPPTAPPPGLPPSHGQSDGHPVAVPLAARRKRGFRKIKACCAQAARDGWSWVWVDTCCIDKTSSSELSESINSMFRWYAGAIVCYAYLSDCYTGSIRGARWLGRGWTLQELIAPLEVVFFDHKWDRIGTKRQLKGLLQELTGIPASILDHSEDLLAQPVVRRMSWAARRETTREEDTAYCLMGIFDVNMPLLYGEGKKAFQRLQEEIVKQCDDHTLYLWGLVPNLGEVFLEVFRLKDRIAEETQGLFLGSTDPFRIPRRYGEAGDGFALNSIKVPRNWSLQGLLADCPARFESLCRAAPLGQLQLGDLPQVTSRGLRLSVHLKEVNSRTHPIVGEYMDMAKDLGPQNGWYNRLFGWSSYRNTTDQWVKELHWQRLPTYLAALDCTGPGEEYAWASKYDRSAFNSSFIQTSPSSSSSAVAASSSCPAAPWGRMGPGGPRASSDADGGGGDDHERPKTAFCACILLVKLPDSPRLEFLRAPLFCHTVPVDEVLRTWRLQTCYIRASHTPSLPRQALFELRSPQPYFGWQLAGASSCGFFAVFRLESDEDSDRIMTVACGAKVGYAYAGVWVEKTTLTRPEQGGEGGGGKGKAADKSTAAGGGQDTSEDEGDVNRESANRTSPLCSMGSGPWETPESLERLERGGGIAWVPARKGLGPVLDQIFEVDGGRKLHLTMRMDRMLDDAHSDGFDEPVDRYTVWMAWKDCQR